MLLLSLYTNLVLHIITYLASLPGGIHKELIHTTTETSLTAKLTHFTHSTMAGMRRLPLHTLVLLLVTVMPLTTAQFLQLVYLGRSGNHPGDNQILLECQHSNTLAVPNPQIWVERSDLPRQPVRIVVNQNGRVTIV